MSLVSRSSSLIFLLIFLSILVLVTSLIFFINMCSSNQSCPQSSTCGLFFSRKNCSEVTADSERLSYLKSNRFFSSNSNHFLVKENLHSDKNNHDNNQTASSKPDVVSPILASSSLNGVINSKSLPVLPVIESDKILRPKNLDMLLPSQLPSIVSTLPTSHPSEFLLFNPNHQLTLSSTKNNNNRTVTMHPLLMRNNHSKDHHDTSTSGQLPSTTETSSLSTSHGDPLHHRHRKHHHRRHHHHNSTTIPRLHDILLPSKPFKVFLLYNRCSGGHVQVKENERRKRMRVTSSFFHSNRRQDQDFDYGKMINDTDFITIFP